MKPCSEAQLLPNYLRILSCYTPLADPDPETANIPSSSECLNVLTTVAAFGGRGHFVLSGSHNCAAAYGDAHQRLSSYRIFDTISRPARLRGEAKNRLTLLDFMH